MKAKFTWITGVFCLLLMAVAATAGTWTPNSFFYQPDLNSRGPDEKSKFDTGMNRVDAHLGKYKTLGDPNYETLAEALISIGSSEVTLTIPAGTLVVAGNTTIGNNIALRVLKGGKFSVNNGATLTINGTIDAGPYQIFTGAGVVTLGGVSTIYDVWYASPPSNPEGQIVAPVGSRFIKTAGGAPLVYVKESGTGATGWVASSGGSGATAFTALNDVPSSYNGQTGKSLRVNSGASGLEFYTPSSSGSPKPFITLGETGYATLSEALTTIGSTATTLVIPAEVGEVPVTGNITIPANVQLRVLNGANLMVGNGVTFHINGPIEAGPYQIFSWVGTGAIDISGSQTTECPLVWWGAQSGTGNNVAPALTQAINGTGHHQVIRVTKGLWRITTPITIIKPWANVRLRGDSLWNSQIYIDVGNNVGITIGDEAHHSSDLEIGDISFIGPAGCCTNALKIVQVHGTFLDNVNFWLGCTDYALNIEGCIWLRGHVRVRNGTDNYFSWAEPESGIRIASTSTYQPNVLDLRVGIAKVNDVGLRLDGTQIHYSIGRITGSIEAYGTKALWANNLDLLTIQDLYVEGNGTEMLLDKCRSVKIQDLLTNDGSLNVKFTQCFNCSIDTFLLKTLEIDQDCRGMVVGTGRLMEWNGLKNEAPDTQFVGNVTMNYGGMQTSFCIPGHDARNLFYNTLLNRWQSDRPDGGWQKDTHNTWTQCGSGLTDTTNHLTPYCAKIVATGGDPWVYFNLDAAQVQQMLGKMVNFTFWGKLAQGQTFNSYPTVFMSFTVPAWQASTTYQEGDGCVPSPGNGKQYFCLTSGTSGSSPPSWPTAEGQTVTDGTAVWVCRDPNFSNISTQFNAADVGKWKQSRVDAYCPKNATGGSGFFMLYRQAGGANGTFYLAEPTLMTGRHGPRGVVPSQNEFQDSAVIGGNKITSGSVASGNPSGWRKRGDQHWWTDPSAGQSPGVVAITSGNPPTWKAMANLAN